MRRLEANLSKKRAGFEQLVGMIEDGGIELVSDREFKPDAPAADQAKVRELMRQLDVKLVALAGGAIKLNMYSFGLAVSDLRHLQRAGVRAGAGPRRGELALTAPDIPRPGTRC